MSKKTEQAILDLSSVSIGEVVNYIKEKERYDHPIIILLSSVTVALEYYDARNNKKALKQLEIAYDEYNEEDRNITEAGE